MQRDDPGRISTEEVKAIGSRYGVDFSQTQVGDLQQIYSEFLAALIPTDETPLTYVLHLSLSALCCKCPDWGTHAICPCLPLYYKCPDWYTQAGIVIYSGSTTQTCDGTQAVTLVLVSGSECVSSLYG